MGKPLNVTDGPNVVDFANGIRPFVDDWDGLGVDSTAELQISGVDSTANPQAWVLLVDVMG
jgi:hypothetical protein